MDRRTWEGISNYESFEIVREVYRARHGRLPGTGHAREISSPFTHARSYFRSATTAERTVKPLLLYYGVLSLSRGLTLFLSRGRRESTLAPAHGLKVEDWGAELCKASPDFGQLRVSVTASGTFRDLGVATNHRSFLKANSSKPNYTHEVDPPATGKRFSLTDIVARIPALREPYRAWKGAQLCCEFMSSQELGRESGRVTVRIPKAGQPTVNRIVAEKIFEGTEFTFKVETSAFFIFDGPDSVSALPGVTDRTNEDFLAIGDLWTVARYPEGCKLSKIQTLFILSYFLGMLVRYYPTQWTALVHGQIDDAALPSLASATELLEGQFPRLVLEFLSDATLQV